MQVRRSLGALEERPFRLLFRGQAATAFGNRMSWVALPFAVLAISDSASALGLVLACATLSMAACLLVGGAVADRLPRRDVMVWSDVRFVSQSVVAVLLGTGSADVWHLAVAQVPNGAAGAFFIPAQQGLVPDVFLPLGMAVVGPPADAVGATAVSLFAAFVVLGSLFMTLLPAIRALRSDDVGAPAVPVAAT